MCNLKCCCIQLLSVHCLAMIILGIAVLILGIRTNTRSGAHPATFNEPYWERSTAGNAVCVLGGLMIVTGLIGLAGYLLEDTCILCGYLYLLMIIFLYLFVLAAMCIWLRFKGAPKASVKFKKMLEDYKKNGTYAEELSVVQSELICCGYENASDYEDNYPRTCCPPGDKNPCTKSSKDYHKLGCKIPLENAIKENTWIMFQCIIIVGAIVVIGILFTVCARLFLRTICEEL